MEPLTLTQSQAKQIIAHARAEAPLEACGLLGGRQRRVLQIYPARNTLRSSTRYLVEPVELLAALQDMAERGWGPDPLAIYHSHPRGPGTPSETDIAKAYYPDSIYIIVAHLERPRPSLRGLSIIAGQVSEVELKIMCDQAQTGPAAQLQTDDGV